MNEMIKVQLLYMIHSTR